MSCIRFNDLADYLRHGREIEFSYKGRKYSITNHSGFWHLCDDTDHVLIKTILRYSKFLIDRSMIRKTFTLFKE